MRNKAVVSPSPSVLAFRFLPCCVLVKDRIGFLPCSSAPLEKWLEQEICFFISFSPTLVSWSSTLNCWFCLHLTSIRIASAVISLRDYTGIQKVLLCMCAMSIQMGTQTCTVVFLWSDNSLQAWFSLFHCLGSRNHTSSGLAGGDVTYRWAVLLNQVWYSDFHLHQKQSEEVPQMTGMLTPKQGSDAELRHRIKLNTKVDVLPGLVIHVCNPYHLRGRGRRLAANLKWGWYIEQDLVSETSTKQFLWTS